MKNLKWKKAGSAVLATALAGSMVLPATAYAQGEIVQLEGGTSTQTNTAPEQVFLNKYSGTVRTQNFNDNWKFYLGDASGAQTPAFDDSSWDQVNLPHDYSIDQKYSQKMEAEKKAEEADFFITTFPVEEPEIMGKPWVRLSPMLDIKEQIALEQLVGNLARHRKWRYESVSKMYLYIDQYMEKIELLNYLCDLCREKRFITEQEAEGIVGRENLVSTEIVEGIAMPHGLIEGSSFLVFALLKEPIIWGRTSVKLVVMGCFQRGDERMKEELEYIFHLFLNLEDKNRLLSCKSAEEIERCMEVYYGK